LVCRAFFPPCCCLDTFFSCCCLETFMKRDALDARRVTLTPGPAIPHVPPPYASASFIFFANDHRFGFVTLTRPVPLPCDSDRGFRETGHAC
jgi:hypothetical protein